MKKLLLSAAAFAALLAAPVAMAQQDQGNDNQARHDTNGGNQSDNRGGDRSGPQGDQMGGPAGGKPDDGQKADRAPARDTTNNNAQDNDRNRDNTNNSDRNKNDRTVVRKTVNRTDVLKFRANITASHRFRFGVYVKPAGWYQHRWAYGERLPVAFYARNYWITDFAMFGLMEPWDGYVWVRDGNDALLIDEDTGEIIRVEYDVFY